MASASVTAETPASAIWQDVECGAYSADLPRLTELASGAGGRVAELGAGTGRVALELARAGAQVTTIEADPELAAVLRARAAERGLEIEVVVADAADAELAPGSLALVVASMQFLHLPTPERRAEILRRVASWLEPGGALAAVLLADAAEATSEPETTEPPLPDVRELGGWVYSSLPVSVRAGGGWIEVERLRQIVSPSGALRESASTDVLWNLSADELAAEAARAGLREAARERLPGDELHADSVLVRLERR